MVQGTADGEGSCVPGAQGGQKELEVLPRRKGDLVEVVRWGRWEDSTDKQWVSGLNLRCHW